MAGELTDRMGWCCCCCCCCCCVAAVPASLPLMSASASEVAWYASWASRPLADFHSGLRLRFLGGVCAEAMVGVREARCSAGEVAWRDEGGGERRGRNIPVRLFIAPSLPVTELRQQSSAIHHAGGSRRSHKGPRWDNTEFERVKVSGEVLIWEDEMSRMQVWCSLSHVG